MQGEKVVIFAIFFLSFPFMLKAQSQKTFFIEDIDVIISNKSFFGGGTTSKNLEYYLDIKRGQTFNSLDILNNVIAAKDKDVKDLRIFRAGGTVTYRLSDSSLTDQGQPIVIIITAKEAFNLFGLPAIKYDSNDGLQLGIRLWHFNAFGSMNSFTGRINYEVDENGHRSFNIGANTRIPFYIKNKQWNLDIGTSLRYAGSTLSASDKDDMEQSVFNIDTGISTSWQLGKSQYKIYTGFVESVNILAAPFYGVKDEDPYYFSSRIYADLPMDLLYLPWFGTLKYTTSVGGVTYYRFDGKVKDKRTGFFPYLSTGFELSNINREDNFFRGLRATMGVNNSLDVSKARNYGLRGEHRNDLDQYPWNVSLYASVYGSIPLSKNFQIKGRFGWNYAVFGDQVDRDLANPVRGIRNNRMQGDMIIYWNTDFVMNLWLWRLAFLGEVHASIFYDGGISRKFRDQWYEPFHSIGIEIIIYPHISRSLQIRMSLGEDLYALYMNKDIRGLSPRDGQPQHELYIGLSLHY